jgi:hypothetical protein
MMQKWNVKKSGKVRILFDQYQFKIFYIHIEIQIDIDLKDTNSNFAKKS